MTPIKIAIQPMTPIATRIAAARLTALDKTKARIVMQLALERLAIPARE
jgi:hypothetical protein